MHGHRLGECASPSRPHAEVRHGCACFGPLHHTLGTGSSLLSMPLRVESRLWTLGVISCEIIRTLPSPNAIAKPPVCGPPKIVGADTFFASCRGASPPKRVLLLE